MDHEDSTIGLSYEGRGKKDDQGQNVSYLSADSVRWMNKRRPKGGSAAAVHVLPSRALQLSHIFKGLDFDDSKTIDIEELKDAIGFVAKHDTSSDKVFKDPKKLMDFFISMDIDKNGVVDFNEFMIAMNSETGAGTDGTKKLQQAFFDFANQHRRQMLLENIKGANIKSTELEKYDDMKKLFAISYFKEETYELTLEDKLARAKADAKKDRADLNLNPIHKETRQAELRRARESAARFKANRAAEKKEFNVVLASLRDSNIPHADRVSASIEGKIRRNASEFPVPIFDTFVPSLNASTSTVNLLNTMKKSKRLKKPIIDGSNTKLRVINEIRDLKAARTKIDLGALTDNRPVSIREYHQNLTESYASKDSRDS